MRCIYLLFEQTNFLNLFSNFHPNWGDEVFIFSERHGILLVNVLRLPMGIGASVEPRKEISPKETLTGWVCEELCCMDTDAGIVSDTIRDTVIFNTIRVSDNRILMLKHQYDTYRIQVQDHVWSIGVTCVRSFCCAQLIQIPRLQYCK